MIVAELYLPTQCPSNTGTAVSVQQGIGGFFCTNSGTLTVTVTGGADIVPLFAVTAGTYYPLPFSLPPGTNITFTTAGGAIGVAGTL